MDKKTVTITLDYDVWLLAKARHENLSGHINDLLTAEQDIKKDDLNAEELKKLVFAKDKLIQALQSQEEKRRLAEEKSQQVKQSWSGDKWGRTK